MIEQSCRLVLRLEEWELSLLLLLGCLLDGC
jgi:hypothetical protein